MRHEGLKGAAVLLTGALAGAGLVLAGAQAARPETSAQAPVHLVVVPTTEPGAHAAPEAPSSSPERQPAPAPAAEAPARLESVTTARLAPGAVERTPVRPPVQAGRRLSSDVVTRLRAPQGQHAEPIRRLLRQAGRLLERGARWDAMATYARILKLKPRDPDALMGIALCYFELGQRARARRLVDEVLALQPGHGRAAILRGFLEQLDGRSAAAARWYTAALDHLEDDQALATELRQVVASLDSATASRSERP